MIIFRKPLTALLASAAMLVIALMVLPRIMPDDYTRQQVARALERETGIELDQASGIRVVLFPRLGIVLDQVALRTTGAADAPAITAERVVADVDPWSLFDRRLKLQRLLIEKPSVVFQANATGRRNWDFGALAPRKPARLASLGDDTPPLLEASPTQVPTLRSRRPHIPTAAIELRNGTLTYLNEARDRRFEIGDLSAVLTSGETGNAALDGSFRFAGENFALHANLQDQISLSEPSAPVHTEISTRAGSAVFDGVASWSEERSLRGQLRLDLVSGAALQDWLGDSARALGALSRASLGGALVIDDQHAAFNDGHLQAGEATGDLDLSADFDGRARFNLHSLDLFGGRATGRMTVDARQPAAVVAGTFEMNDVESLAMFKTLSGFDWLSGRGVATLNIAGGGKSMAEVLSTLTGEGRLSVTDGAIEGLDLPELIAKARDGEFKTWRRRMGQRTRFDSLNSVFTLDKGIAKSRELAMTGPELVATGEGETNIPGQSLDYRLKVKVKAATEEELARAEDGQVEIPLILRGAWDKPDIYPDLDQVLHDPKALGDAARVIGKSVEKLTEGKVKSDDIGRALESLFGGKKKRKTEKDGSAAREPD
jgi:uncharacterized protein involved in outer membrane biogenesis